MSNTKNQVIVCLLCGVLLNTEKSRMGTINVFHKFRGRKDTVDKPDLLKMKGNVPNSLKNKKGADFLVIICEKKDKHNDKKIECSELCPCLGTSSQTSPCSGESSEPSPGTTRDPQEQ
uniref:Uncharacterized protein n=1 Tax=Urocitellus parryii TaxID=9999 RepID=A0A8D2KKJ5_UROPR